MNLPAIFSSSALALAFGTAAFAAQYPELPDVNILPKDAVQLSPVVPLMGEHWANPANMPLGPIYCVHEGKVVCIEYMISQEDFMNGKSWPVLQGLTNLPSINHIDIGFNPKGHHGYEIPHFDMHIFFISPEEKALIK
jgi:hypothetical protein